MLKGSLIIPLPPGFMGEDYNGASKHAAGLYPCLDDACGEYVLIKINNRGKPYGTCSAKEITICGCNGRAEGSQAAIPPQTLEAYQQRLEEVTAVFPMSQTYRSYLERAWQKFNEGSEHEQSSLSPSEH